MAILTVYCKKCRQDSSLCGFIQKSDLKGTKYESQMNTITDEELDALKWDGKCPNCGSDNVITF